jgi:hypothetical protein
MKKTTVTLLICILAFSVVAQSESLTGKEVVKKMYTMYNSTWYPTVTFRQQTLSFKDGVQISDETWYEAMDMKKGLVIKINSMDSGNGLIFRNDSLLVYREDKLISKRRKVHELLVLGFTVYTDAPETTLAKLNEAGFNTEIVSRDTYDGRSHFVVGDSAKAQFWIDEKTLLFTKMMKKQPNQPKMEIEFKGYQPLGKAWIETEVIFLRNGQLMMRELYNDIQSPVLPKSFYDQSVFTKIRW